MLLKFLFYNILFLLLIHEDNIYQENLRCVVRLLSLPTFGKFSYDCLIRERLVCSNRQQKPSSWSVCFSWGRSGQILDAARDLSR